MVDANDPKSFVLRPTSPVLKGARILNAMTVDVEEHFQVQALSAQVPRSDWDSRPSRVEASTHRVLDIFGEAGIKATFFTLGWVGERHPALLRRIVGEGHEVGSHGYAHIRVDSQTPEAFRADIRKTKRILEDASGTAVNGYRAATFSIGRTSLWSFGIMAEEGYLYSSSISPIAHDLYGIPDAPRWPFVPPNAAIEEFPVATVRLGNRNFPCGGGGFFRILPYAFSRWAIGRINNTESMPAMFYFHPWEVDPGQPREPGLALKSRFRHYTNLGRMAGRLKRLVKDFAWDRVDKVYGLGSASR